MTSQFIELSAEQRRVFIDAIQLYEAYRAALSDAQNTKGSMRWKKTAGHQYLFRGTGGEGLGKSLGRRSAETESIMASFNQRKSESVDRLSTLKGRLVDMARMCKAVRIARVPAIVTDIAREADKNGLLGQNLKIIGTNAIFAYEAAAGVSFDRKLLATQDMDILWDARAKLRLNSDLSKSGFMGLLTKADRSFRRAGGKYSHSAVNKSGYMVDLIKATPRPPWKVEATRIGSEGDLDAAEIDSQRWISSSPAMDQVVIGEDGFPARMVVPDPRAFAIHKLWLSQDPSREPLKQSRDRAQAFAVAHLVDNYLVQHPFTEKEACMFPKSIRKQAVESKILPPGF